MLSFAQPITVRDPFALITESVELFVKPMTQAVHPLTQVAHLKEDATKRSEGDVSTFSSTTPSLRHLLRTSRIPVNGLSRGALEA